MPFDWSSLRIRDPASLAPARVIVHHALQWPVRAARANLPSVRDDNPGLSWHPGTWAMFTPSLPGGVRVGLRFQGPALLFAINGAVEDGFPLAGGTAPQAYQWLDRKLEHAGLKAASHVRLPYRVPMPDYARAAHEAPQLAALAAWCAAAIDLLEEQRAKYLRFGVTPVRCRPQPLCLAFLAALERGARTRSIDIGVSLGDRYYAEPYAYVSPDPRLDAKRLPGLPPAGRWHTQGFFAAIATATGLLALPDPRRALAEVIDAAFEAAARLAA